LANYGQQVVSGSEANIVWDFKNEGTSGDIHENKGTDKKGTRRMA
jgi:hypothetical protein